MENSEQPNQKKSNNLFFMILSGVLTLVSLFLAYQLYNQKTLTEIVTVEKEKVIIGLLWTAKAAAQTNDVSKDNGPPPKVRPAQGTVKPGKVVNPDAEELLK